LTAFYFHQIRMNIAFSGFDKLHPLGQQRYVPDQAALGRAGVVANPRDTTGYRCGLRLASPPDDDLLKRIQLPFLG
jgi:hypothetical protein